MEWANLISHTPADSDARKWLAEVHKRIALPAACLVFGLLGVGFGITNVRTGRSFGLLLGLAITIIFYLLALWGQHAALAGTLPVWLGVWLPISFWDALGVAVLVAQRRPGWDPLAALSSIRHAWPWGGKGEGASGRQGERESRRQGEGASGRQGEGGIGRLGDVESGRAGDGATGAPRLSLSPSPRLPLAPSPPLPVSQPRPPQSLPPRADRSSLFVVLNCSTGWCSRI